MDRESKKDLIIGMLYSLAWHFKYEFNDQQNEALNMVKDTINELYYKKPDLSQPTTR